MRLPVFVLLSCAALACSGVGDSADPKTIVPVEDPNAKVVTQDPPARVEKLSIMDSLPSGGICSVQNYRRGADVAQEIRYETSAPKRSYIVNVGRPPRTFLPVSLEISGTQDTPGLQETENVFIGFNGDGSINAGVRRYMSTGTVSTNDRGPLLEGDGPKATDFVNRILANCGG